jgi:hypothetical protein
MARNNPKPGEKIDWDAAGEIVTPSPGRKTSGWLFGVKPPAQNFNWFWNLVDRFAIYFSAQVEDWIVIDSDADEGDYATLAAYIADAPTSGNRVLIKETQVLTSSMTIPGGITLRILEGSTFTRATLEASSVILFNSNIIIEGVLNLVLSHTGTTDKAISFAGDRVVGKVVIENASTGILTTAYHINTNRNGNKIDGVARNAGGGTLTNVLVDNSSNDSNILTIVDESNEQVVRSRGAYKFRDGLEYDLGSDANGDIYYRDAGVLKRLGKGADDTWLKLASGIPSWSNIGKFLGGLSFNIGSDADGDIYYRDDGVLKRLSKGPEGSFLSVISDLPSWFLINPNWSNPSKIGSDLNIPGISSAIIAAMNNTDVAFLDSQLDSLRLYRFDGSVWALIGSGFTITLGPGEQAALTRLTDNDVAFVSQTIKSLRAYSHNGSVWALVGSGLTITMSSTPSLATLSDTDVVLSDANKIRTFRFNGSTWAQVGNTLSISGAASSSITSLDSDLIAYIDPSQDDLRTYRFDGTDWVLVGNELNIPGLGGNPSITSLNSRDIVLIDDTSNIMRIYRWDDTDWTEINGTSFTITGGGGNRVSALNGQDIAFIDVVNEDLRKYRFPYSLTIPHQIK